MLFSCGSESEKEGKKEKTDSIVQNSEKEVVSFVYHRFGDKRFPSTNISIESFESHLKYLTENNFKLLTFSEAVDYLKNDLPENKVAVITIDDGYKSFYKNAFPLLIKYKVPATLFINTSTIGKDDYMSWTEIKEVNKRGVEIGNHTHSHQYFLNLPIHERHLKFEEEVKLSQSIIKDELGRSPKVFAYPYGELDLKMKAIIKKLGFIGAAAQNSGVIHSNSDKFICPRFPMTDSYGDISGFAQKANMSPLKILEGSPLLFDLEDQSDQKLEVLFDKGELIIDRLQCFIQGSECKSQISINDKGLVRVIIQPKELIVNRRRVLFTITVPDRNNNWYWYSYLFISPDVN
ncbi:polysaccharide deacetylase family protein [Marinigracilibium pacificum]|uniref:Polysaccharide deacetylase family protein n=1 Tax=Marinigracilibium pacificum TaxID=2729599 RepID=A0A848J2D9_9BACT|nr:polysaccharide deacetylase family protein [Marinigracilibium pacificum]NMM49946.1 polysaccharide deacetylase family protein [Marinigracilibium pacificum]